MKNILSKYKYILVIIFILILVCIYVFNNYKVDNSNLNEEVEIIDKVEEKINTNYYIDIKGEVNNPGVYEISSDSRLIDVVNIAGGLTDNADISLLNLSKKVVDEMNIKIYSKKEVNDAINEIQREPEVIEIIKEIEKECICPSINNDACINNNKNITETNNEENNNLIEDINDELININTATIDELVKIPGIGESKASSIIKYREKNKFITIEDIKNVSGIGDSTFENIKSYITV